MSGKRISTIRLINTETWNYRELPGVHENPEIIRYSNDGRFLAVLEVRSDAYSSLKIYDTRTLPNPTLVHTITVEQIVDRMDCFAFCPTGQFLVIGWNLGEKLRVYRTDDWSVVSTGFEDYWLASSQINGVKFSNDGRRMYVCATTTHPDGCIAVYDMVNWVRLPQWRVQNVPNAYWIDVSNAKNQMALYDGKKLWLVDMSTWSVVHEVDIAGGDFGYTGVDYNEDGSYVAVTGGPTGALVYNTTTFAIEDDLTNMGLGRGGSAVFDKRPQVAAPFDRLNNVVTDLGLVAVSRADFLQVYGVNDMALRQTVTQDDVAAAASLPNGSLSIHRISDTFIPMSSRLVFTVWSDNQRPTTNNEG